VQIGSDAGLLAAPVPLDSLLIGPGERYDVIVDFGRYRPGTSVTLGGLVRFDVGSRVADDSSIPLRLAPDLEPAGTAVTTRSFRFLGGAGGLPSTVNLRTYRPDRVDARPRLGTTEIWNLSTDPEHPIHLHLGQFRILDRGGAPPTLQDGGWKDTVLIRGGSARIAVRFTGFRGRYVFHCHNLEHEDMMMMANLEVV